VVRLLDRMQTIARLASLRNLVTAGRHDHAERYSVMSAIRIGEGFGVTLVHADYCCSACATFAFRARVVNLDSILFYDDAQVAACEIHILAAAICRFDDRRRRASVAHSMRDMLAQRIYGLCCGWEDVCDHNVLRRDLALQTAVGRVDALASAPTLSRLETSSTRAHAAALHGVLLDQFIASKAGRPKELVLDIDATHMPLHGSQEKAHFHRYYDNYCYLPLYVFCGQDILACVLRPAAAIRPAS
jgi:hypothetical protein